MPGTKARSKCFKYLDIRSESLMHTRGSIGIFLHNIEAKVIKDKISLIKQVEAKIKKRGDYIKLKWLLHLKENDNQDRKIGHGMREIIYPKFIS